MMADGASYTTAHNALKTIMQDKLFHTPTAPMPWWMKALQWVFKHLHFNLGIHALRDVGFALGAVCIVLLLTAAVVVWRILRGRAQGLAVHVAWTQANPNSLLEQAAKAYDGLDYYQMLHFLIEAQLVKYAEAGYVRLRPSKTLRAYSRELSRAQVDEASTLVFHRTASVAEAVWFGQQTIEGHLAQQLLTDVASCLEPHGERVS